MFLLRGAWVYPSVEEAGMMRENWTEGGEDDEEGKRRCCRKRERKREKDERKVKRGTGYGTAGLRGWGGKRRGGRGGWKEKRTRRGSESAATGQEGRTKSRKTRSVIVGGSGERMSAVREKM